MDSQTLRYVNHDHETVSWGPGGHLHVLGTTAHDWDYDYTVQMNEVVHQALAAREFTLKSVMSGGSAEERDRMHRILAADADANVDGVMEAPGGWRLPCRVVKSKKDLWWADGSYMRDELTFAAANPVWTRESVTSFAVADGGGAASDAGKGYAHGYAYDYRLMRRVATSVVSEFGACDFLLRVHGPCVDPYVVIGGNRHGCAVSLAAGQALEIDTRAKSAVVVYSGGSTSNAYPFLLTGSVDSGHYPFRKAPAGESGVSWDGSFAFDVILYEERSEPEWTA